MLKQDEPTLLNWALFKPMGRFAARCAGARVAAAVFQSQGALLGVAALAVAWVAQDAQLCALLGCLAVFSDGVGRAAARDDEGLAGIPLLTALAPLRTGVILVALASLKELDAMSMALLPAVVMVLFFDLTAFRIALKIRGAYRGLYKPTPHTGDPALTRLNAAFRRTGLSPVLAGYDEIAVVGLLSIAVLSNPAWALGGMIALASIMLYWRLSLDSALIRQDLAA